VLVIPNLINPVALIWASGITQAGYELILYDLSAGGPPDADLTTADVVVHWWGIESLDRWPADLRRLARDVPTVLCVDTFPNAAFARSARRELRAAASSGVQPAGLICYSDEMECAVKEAIRSWRSLPSISLPMPLLDQTLCRCTGCSQEVGPAGEASASNGVVFQGRADLLFGRDPRMSKDHLGPALKKVVESGTAVTVQEGSNTPQLREYRRFTQEEMLDGSFTTFLSRFDGQLAVYRETNRTIRHRVGNGLSTRFGLGLASCAPILVSSSAGFALSGPYADFSLAVRPDLSDVHRALLDRDRLDAARAAHRDYLRSHRWSLASGILKSVLG
jgi:hypothetical protein